eukprot:gene2793-biopygen10398
MSKHVDHRPIHHCVVRVKNWGGVVESDAKLIVSLDQRDRSEQAVSLGVIAQATAVAGGGGRGAIAACVARGERSYPLLREFNVRPLAPTRIVHDQVLRGALVQGEVRGVTSEGLYAEREAGQVVRAHLTHGEQSGGTRRGARGKVLNVLFWQ